MRSPAMGAAHGRRLTETDFKKFRKVGSPGGAAVIISP